MDKNEVFDHVVVVGECSFLRSSLNFNKKNITFFEATMIKFDVHYEKLLALIQSLPKKTLWIFLADISLISEPVSYSDSLCSEAIMTYCTNRLNELTLIHSVFQPFINARVAKFETSIKKLAEVMPSESSSVCAPMMPLKVMCTEDIALHSSLHDILRKSPGTFFSKSPYEEWVRTSEKFVSEWELLRVKLSGKICIRNIILNYLQTEPKTIQIHNVYVNACKNHVDQTPWFDMLRNVVTSLLPHCPVAGMYCIIIWFIPISIFVII